MEAAVFVQTSLPDFHNERIHTLFVFEEQEKPQKFDSDQYFVVSKIDVTKDKNQVNFMDFNDRQFFHKYEKAMN